MQISMFSRLPFSSLTSFVSVQLLAVTLCLMGCGQSSSASTSSDSTDPGSSPTDGTGGAELPPPSNSADRPEMTAEACEGQGGTVVGDIGDGAIHRPGYRCADGQEPVGTIPLGVEGSVCCPAPSCAAGGAPPTPGPHGIPENCSVLYQGCCYAEAADACRAANCGDNCVIAESYPGQVAGCD